MSVLAAESVSYHFPDHSRLVVRELSLEVVPGRLVQLAGRNGSGKTTALRLLAGELSPTSGQVHRSAGARVLYLDQRASAILASELTINDHIRAFREDDGVVSPLADLAPFQLDLGRLLPKFAGQLSGGERQIFALLCAVGGRYDFLLLDEFTSHLDDASERAAFALVQMMLERERIGVVLVSHRPVKLPVHETLYMEVSYRE